MIFANVLKVLYYFHFGNGNIVVLKSYGRISYENAFWREKVFFSFDTETLITFDDMWCAILTTVRRTLHITGLA